MAEETEATETPEGDAAEGGAPAKKSPKMLIIVGGVGALLVVLVGVAALLLFGGGGDDHAKGGDDAAHGEAHADAGAHGEGHGEGYGGGHDEHGDGHAAPATEVIFYELPQLLVNIRAEDGRPTYLKLKLTLEVDSEDTVHGIEPAMPRVLDRFQSFLRELRVEDLSGSAGSYRLRVELLRRINLAVAPARVQAVLIEEMLIQ